MTTGDVFIDTNVAHRLAFIITFISITIESGFVNGIFCKIIRQYIRKHIKIQKKKRRKIVCLATVTMNISKTIQK